MTLAQLTPENLALTACGIFFMVGLLTGVWKYAAIMKNPQHEAHIYINIAHRASLLYSFACLILKEFALLSTLPYIVELLAVGASVLCFGAAIITYVILGITQQTDNQFKYRNIITTWGMYLLIIGEVGGFGVLLWSALKNMYFLS